LLASIIEVPGGVSIKGGRPSQAGVQLGAGTLVDPSTGLTQVSLPDDAIDWQLALYPKSGEPGISYFKGDLDTHRWVDCLLWRDEDGKLRGVFNYFQLPIHPERRGNFNVLVQVAWRRRGIATALLDEASRRWKLDFDQQKYTPDGAAFVMAWRNQKTPIGPARVNPRSSL